MSDIHALDDGRQACIRRIRHDDADALRGFIKALSPRTRRARFLEQINEPSDALIGRLVDVDHANDEAFVAVDAADPSCLVGVARYAVDNHPTEGEIAVTVMDDWQGSGLDRALMQPLMQAARANGLTSMISIDPANHHPMRELAQALGFTTGPDPDDSTQVIHRLQL
ncbi:MAG: GNAT family N-acetyltransferase [Pseudoxanthomonas suwonensis]|nr:GNAT family N-acetyltransferase [Pseudoxanthomonas suwonensis]